MFLLKILFFIILFLNKINSKLINNQLIIPNDIENIINQTAVNQLLKDKNVDHSDELLKKLYRGFKFLDFTSNDTKLKALLFDPKPTTNSINNKNPCIIFISSWGMNKYEYIVPANEYAKKGYTVFSYTARGFWLSQGEISMAGIDDQNDVQNAITWVIQNTNADPTRIGLSGISYGGGLSLLGSSVDIRVKSLTAMSCWVDLAQSFLGNGETIRAEAVKVLQILGDVTGKPSDILNEIFNDYLKNINLNLLYDYTYNSSVLNFVNKVNNHNPAIFIANALGDSLFTPNQFIDFFNNKLTVTSKHLEFAPGDHAGPGLIFIIFIIIFIFYFL